MQNIVPWIASFISVVSAIISLVLGVVFGLTFEQTIYFVISVVIGFLCYGYSLRFNLNHIPGPPPHFFSGSYPDMIEQGLMTFYQRCAHLYGPVCRIFQGRSPLIVVSDPEILKEISRDTQTFHDRPFVLRNEFLFGNNRFGNGLLVLRGEKWRKTRNAIVPTFSVSNLVTFVPAINRAATRLLANIKNAGMDPIDAMKYFSALTMEVVGSVAFGTYFPTQDFSSKGDHPIASAGRKLFQQTERTSYSRQIIDSFPFLLPILPRRIKSFLELSDVLDSVSLDIVKKRKLDEKWETYKDFMTYLLQAKDENGESFNEDQVANHCRTFLLAGQETTANALTFTTFLLSLHKEYEAKMIEEIDRLTIKFNQRKNHTEKKDEFDENFPTYEGLKEFKYVEAAINEALRMYPPAITIREARKDTTLGKYSIPKGTGVVCNTYSVHYGSDYSHPETFNPERFLDCEENTKRNKYAHIPFGFGQRMCIGKNFAMEEAKLVLIRLYQKYTFHLHPSTKLPLMLRYGITNTTLHPIFLVPTPRHP